MVKNPPSSAGNMRLWFDPWIGTISWKRMWQSTPVFLPREFLGQRSLAGYRVAKKWTRLKQLSTSTEKIVF